MNALHKERGIQLVELLVAMAIASVIALAISRAYMASFQIQNSQLGSMRLNETIRFAFDLLGRELQQAGFSNNWQAGTSTPRLCSKTATGSSIVGLNDVSGNIAPAADDFVGSTHISINSSDILRVRYFGEDGSSQTSPILDCHGYPVAAGGTTPIQDTLFIALDPATNEPTLYCDTSNTRAAGVPRVLPLVTGVESLQILYGLDTNADGLVDQYIPWNLVGTNSDLIVSVKLSIVVRSSSETAPDASAITFAHFGSGSYTSAVKTANSDTGATFVGPRDKRIRSMSTTEIGVRNFSYCG